MKYSYNWLRELAGFKEGPEKLAEVLTMKSFEVEFVEKSGNDWKLNVAILPNRVPDSSGHFGLSREISAMLGLKFNAEKFGAKQYPSGGIRQMLDVEIENPEDSLRYMAIVLDGVKVKDSPAWMKERLELCGIQSINNLVDAANYVMLETGQPLHVFDWNNLRGKKKGTKGIRVRRAKKGEKLKGLDEKDYVLSPDILVIADGEGPVAIAGIKGGKGSGVSKDTKTIVLEAANFSQSVVRRGSRELNLKTDASLRFEHGLDPNLADFAIRRLADLIIKLAGGASKGLLDVYPKKDIPRSILFTVERSNAVLGETLTAHEYKKIFESLGFKAEEKSKTEFLVEIPTIRRDISIEEDLIEEAGRIYGYEKIKPVLPSTSHIPDAEEPELYWEARTRDLLKSSGYIESFVYEFTGSTELSLFEESSNGLLELENPVSPETKYLLGRPVLKYILQTAENIRNNIEIARLFGVAKSIRAGGKGNEEPANERKTVSIVLGQKGGKNGEEFYEVKGAVDALLESLGIAEHWYDEKLDRAEAKEAAKLYHPYRRAEIKIDDECIGCIGEVHPATRARIKTKARIVAAELDMKLLAKHAESDAHYSHISKFPAIIRDIAVIVPESVKTEDVLNVVEGSAGGNLFDTDLFDYFQDEKMEEGEEKSLAFHLIFQSSEKTLTDGEADASIAKIVKALEAKSWTVRK